MPIDPLQLFVIPMGIALIALFAAALLYDIRANRRRKKKEETVYRCMGCHRIYVGAHHTPLAPCPKCGKQNATLHQH